MRSDSRTSSMFINSLTKRKSLMKQCQSCGVNLGIDSFCPTRSIFYIDDHIPFCNDCLTKLIEDNECDWAIIDKLCQYIDVPFIPREWEKIQNEYGAKGFPLYAQLFTKEGYDTLDWSEYCAHYSELEKSGTIAKELPLFDQEYLEQLTKKWGKVYSDEDFDYLESLLNGLMNTQNVNGNLQLDQAKKLCKISLEIDHRIEEGVEFDKMLSSYDKLVKIAEFTPKNAKNINDLDSVGELFKWLEKRNYKCSFYTDVPKDVVDETMKNIESWNQRLYINENGIGEEITRRIDALKTATELEHRYDLQDPTADELDDYEVAGIDGLFGEADEEFNEEVD